MGNIIDYVKWRGDITFQEQPFNHVDNLVFAVLSYLDFEGIVDEKKEISLQDVCLKYEKLHGEIDVLKLLHQKKMFQAQGMMILGIIFVAFPTIASKLIGTVCFLGLLFYSVIRLYRFYKDYSEKKVIDKYKVLFFSAIAGIEVLCIIKNSIVQISVNLILGGVFVASLDGT